MPTFLDMDRKICVCMVTVLLACAAPHSTMDILYPPLMCLYCEQNTAALDKGSKKVLLKKFVNIYCAELIKLLHKTICFTNFNVECLDHRMSILKMMHSNSLSFVS